VESRPDEPASEVPTALRWIDRSHGSYVLDLADISRPSLRDRYSEAYHLADQDGSDFGHYSHAEKFGRLALDAPDVPLETLLEGPWLEEFRKEREEEEEVLFEEWLKKKRTD